MKGKVVLLVDSFEDINNAHDVNDNNAHDVKDMAVFVARSIFLKSIYTAETQKDAEIHAHRAKKVLDAYGVVK